RQDSRSVYQLARIESLANEQTALEFEAIAAQAPVLLDVREHLAGLRRDTEEALAALAQLEGGAVPPAVDGAYRTYSSILDEEFSLLAVWRISDARRVNTDRGLDSFAALRNAIRQETARSDARASVVGRISDVGSLVGLVATAAVLTLLLTRLARARLAIAAAEEQALRQSEARTRSLVQNSSDVVTVVQPDLTVQYQSGSVERVFAQQSWTYVGRSV